MTHDRADTGLSTAPARDRRAMLLDFGLSQSPVIFYVADFEPLSRILFISPNVEAITGHKPSAFIEDPLFARGRIHPDDLSAYLDAVRGLETRGKAAHEYRFRNGDGAYLWFRDELRLVDDDGGTGREFIGCMIDITERVLAEQESRRLSRLLRDAVESIPNGFGIYDPEDRLILCNQALAALFGGTPDGLAGSSAIDNTRRMLRQVRDFDGRRVGDPEASLPRALARTREAEREPIEMQLDSGRWVQLTSHALADGGRVEIKTDITRLKQAEDSLRESEEQFRSIVEGNPSPVRVADFETWEILYESPAAAALFGRPWPSKQGRSTRETYADMGAREEVIRALETEGRIDNHEIMMKRTDGATVWVALSSRVVRYHGKRVSITSLVDLTEAKRREAELLQARETLEDAIESLSEGLVLYDASDRLVMCNSQYKSFHGDNADLLVPGAAWPEITRERATRGLFLNADGRMEEWLEGQMAQRGIAINEEFPWTGGRWFEYSHRPTRQGGFVSTWRDITERKKMEQSLRDSEELVRHVLEACPVPITMTRADDGVIIYESPAARTLLNYDEPQEGKSVVARWVNPEARQVFLERLRRRGAVDGEEVLYRRADGGEFWCALSSRLIDYRGEEVIVTNLFDLTERRAAEAELAQQREMLHQSEKLSALGELLAGVSHELNNPLSVLVGQSLLLRETAPDERITARAEKIGNAANRCARIVKTFLAMARQEPGEATRVDLNTVIDAALEVTAYGLRTSGVQVSLRKAEDLPPVMADPDQMRQVFINLLVNAQHALQDCEGPRRLRISSTYRPRSNQVVVKVKDNGPGISAEIRSRIFEPLYTTKEVGTGTGIGLTLCHRIIEAHGGTIAVESAPGDGAAFAIRLPATKAPDERLAKAASADASPERCRVLIVEDEHDVGQIISEVLEIDGHAVEVAKSGRAALEKIKRQSYDAILSDVRMPQMDGPSFYRALGEIKPEQRDCLAFITGDSLSPKVKKFLDASERPYLEKPITPRDIRDLVDRLTRPKKG